MNAWKTFKVLFLRIPRVKKTVGKDHSILKKPAKENRTKKLTFWAEIVTKLNGLLGEANDVQMV